MILRIKDSDGNIQEIVVIKGEDGKDGNDGTNGRAYKKKIYGVSGR